MAQFDCQAAGDDVVKEPAVAGQFYTANPEKLREEILGYLAQGAAVPGHPRLLISPHAGHMYSGRLAGMGFSAIDPAVETVILLGPSHRVPFRGIAASGADCFATPLGNVPIDKKIVTGLVKSGLVSINDRAHEAEHCLEVQLPFLQVKLKKFSIVPLLVLDVDAQAAARLLASYLDDKTIIVASSDFAHVYNYEECTALDEQSVATITSGNVNGPIEACGEMPIRILMRIAKLKGLSPVKLAAKNSQDITGQKGGGYVVGYASIVYINDKSQHTSHKSPKEEQPAQPSGDSKAGARQGADEQIEMALADSDKAFLLALARDALDRAVKGEAAPKLEKVPALAHQMCGCFVTLTTHGDLRGCIGYIEGIKPLYQAVIDNARNAALGDPRFPNVTPAELKDIKVEVSVLTRPVPFEYDTPQHLLAKLEPGKDGIILRKGFNQSTFLPQVWDQLPDKVQFLEHLSRKAGLPADEWKTAEYRRYRAIHFEED